MAGGLQHHHQIDGHAAPSIRSAAFSFRAATSDCEQVAEASPLYSAPAACSPLSSPVPCGRCAGTPARRCCLTIAASLIAQPIAGNFQNLTAPTGEPA